MAVRPGTKHQARPTTYKGIKMRSRLEANFAQTFLDAVHPGEWDYEPECFGSELGQYLPDFLINGGWYIEVKPASLPVTPGDPRHPDTSMVDEVLERMEIIWASKPTAMLFLFLWHYDEGAKHLFGADGGGDRVWWWMQDAGEGHLWALWPGRGQLAAAAARGGG